MRGTDPYKYLTDRGIQEQTMSKYHLRRLLRKDLPPSKQDRWNEEYIRFPYEDPEGDVVMYKWLGLERKDGKKEIGSTVPQYATLWGHWLVNENTKRILITEGECLSGDTQVLTPSGWTNLVDYDPAVPVLTVGDEESHFAVPLAKIDKPYNGDLIRWSSPQVDIAATPEHNVVCKTATAKGWTKKKAKDIRCQHSIPKSTLHDADGLDLTDDQIRLLIAISADAAVHKRKSCGDYLWFGLKKERKVARLRQILESTGVEYKENQSKDKEYTQIKFTCPEWSTQRLLSWDLVHKTSLRQKELILEELVEWDGNRVPNRNQTEYSTKYEHNADVVQAIAHLSGRSSTKIYRSNQHGEWIKISILHGKSTAIVSDRYKTSEFAERVYCVQTRTGKFLARRNGKVFVIGNCDAMSVDQMCPDIPSLSMPTGASNLDWINNDYERLQQFEKIYILTDMDTAGEQAAQKIAKRLGLTRCFRVSLPEGYKDANDFLMSKEHGKPTFDSLLDEAKTYDPQQLRSASDYAYGIAEEIERFEIESQSNNFIWAELPFRFRQGEMTVVTGYPGHGKSQAVYQMLLHEMIVNKRKVCLASFEIPAKNMLFNLLWMLNGRSPRVETIDEELKVFEDLLWFIESDEDNTASWVGLKEDFLYANRRFGCDLFVVDALMHITKKGDAEGTDLVAKQAAKFCVVNDSSMILICHADAKKRGNDHVPEVEDVLGGQGIGGAAHNVISVWRNKDKERKAEEGCVDDKDPDGKLYISKQRATGNTVFRNLWFSKNTRKFFLTAEEALYKPSYKQAVVDTVNPF
jgi:KaiC/GvpD/RAD55 family RecA-like ATPase